MLQFQTTDGKEIQIEREGLEALTQDQLLNKLDEMRTTMPKVYRLLKFAFESAPMMGVDLPFDIPKGVNPIEFIGAYSIKLLLDMIDNKPIPVAAKVIDLNGDTN